jgi:hypothetical protein
MAFQFPEDEVDAHREGRILRTPLQQSIHEQVRQAQSSMESGDYHDAMGILLLALQGARDARSRGQEHHILSLLGEVYLELRQYEAAMKCHQLAIKVLKADMKTWISDAQSPQEKRIRTQAAATPPAGMLSAKRRTTRRRRSKSKTSKGPKCPECKSVLESGDKFCMGCGKEVTSSK